MALYGQGWASCYCNAVISMLRQPHSPASFVTDQHCLTSTQFKVVFIPFDGRGILQLCKEEFSTMAIASNNTA